MIKILRRRLFVLIIWNITVVYTRWVLGTAPSWTTNPEFYDVIMPVSVLCVEIALACILYVSVFVCILYVRVFVCMLCVRVFVCTLYVRVFVCILYVRVFV